MYALIKNNTVENVILSDAAFAASIAHQWDAVAPAPDNCGVGWTYADGVFTSPVITPAPTPPEDPRIWWIDVGPFKDRLSMDALAIAASSHDVCKAVIEMLNGRKYCDLKDPKIAQLLGILVATAQPAANAYFPGSGPMTAAKVTAILTTATTEAERNIKGIV